MRKILFLMMMAVAMVSQGQSVTRTVTLKNLMLGNQKLVAAVGKDTVYAVLIKTSNRYQKHITVGLGNRSEAIRLLTFLNDTEVRKGDIIDLENETHNLVTKNSLGGLLVYSEGRQFSGQLSKSCIKSFIETIKEFAPE